jgi:stage II sporulation protein D
MTVRGAAYEGRDVQALFEAVPASENAADRLNRAGLLEDLGRVEEAVREYETAVRLAPNDARVLAAWGRAAFGAGNRSSARQALARALESDPEEPEALRAMGELEMAEERWEEAASLFRRLTGQTPVSAQAVYRLGQALRGSGRLEEAAQSFEEALRIDPQYVEIRAELADLREKAKEHDKAWVEYSKVADFDPRFAQAEKQKKLLAGLLSKPKDELIPTGRVIEHARLDPAPDAGTLPVLRVGLGADMRGNPARHSRVTIRSNVAFRAVPEGGGTPISLAASEPWAFETGPGTGTFRAVGRSQKRSVLAPKGLRLVPEGFGTFIVEGLPFGREASWAGKADRELRGELELRWDSTGRGFFLVNGVNLEEYLYGVLASEMPPHWPAEALKAQAVIARSEALYRRNARPHRRLGFDLCDEQHCQAYGGVKSEGPTTREAVDSTRGRILTHAGKIAHAVYFSNCGGHTQSGDDIGWGKVPYWKGVPDTLDGVAAASPWKFRLWILRPDEAYCAPSRWAKPSHYRWSRTVLAKDLERYVSKRRRTGEIRRVSVVSRGPAGHVLKLRVEGAEGAVTLDRDAAIRRLSALASLRSTLFLIEQKKEDGRLTSVTFHGAGWGHGVGMCQSGAAGRAQDGMTHDKILSHYYPGTSVEDRTSGK